MKVTREVKVAMSSELEHPSGVRIRQAKKEDAVAIESVLRQSFAEYVALYTPEGYAATTPERDEIAARMEEGPAWIACDGEQIVGTVSVLLKPSGTYIRSMAVTPSARGFGIAKRLLSKIEQFAKTQASTRLFLSTTPFLNHAIRLYEASGFRRTNEGPHNLFGTPLFTMEKSIVR
jgi:N-acetylglutamate synthase-like GNAT family acetyltransferase